MTLTAAMIALDRALTHRKCARNGVPAGAGECASVGLVYGTDDERTQSGNEEVGIGVSAQ